MKNQAKNKNIIAIITARGDSKRIPKKNIKLLAGKPLIAYTIEEALKSEHLNRVIVSTENKEIAEISKKYGAEILKRPKELAQDNTPSQPVLEHAVNYLEKKENYKPDIIVLLQPNSPFRTFYQINEAIAKFLKGKYNSLLSVYPSSAFIWRVDKGKPTALNYDYKKRVRTQDKEPEYRENGAIYITNYDILMKKHNILDGKLGLYVMPEKNSIDIDTEFDFWLCEQMIKKLTQISYEN